MLGEVKVTREDVRVARGDVRVARGNEDCCIHVRSTAPNVNNKA